MLKVGIHDNIVVNKVTKNDKGQLVIGFQKAEAVDPLAALNGTGTTTFEPAQQDIIPFDIKVENFGKQSTSAEVMKEIANYKDRLDHILAVYLTNDKRKWDIWKDTGVTAETLDKLTDQEVVTKVQRNIDDQFLAMITPFVGTTGKKVRVLFTRQSATKHYPSLRNKFLDTNPFIEPMDVPASKLKFTKYEIEKGLNNPNPVDGATPANKTEAQQASALFAK